MVLVTGASGFVGSALAKRLAQSPQGVIGAVRDSSQPFAAEFKIVRVAGLGIGTDWSPALVGITTVVHTAARVHVMNDTVHDPLTEFRRVNVEGTLELARQAAKAGVRQFIFVSSIKVNGEMTVRGAPFRSSDAPAPVDPYGISKLEAEEGLRSLAAATGMGVTIIRPPLVYGPGAKANFLAMMQWVKRGVPLPLGAIDNKRSLVALDNLTDLIVTCINHPSAHNRTFLVSDGEDLSTTALLRKLAEAMDMPARLIPVPKGLLIAAAAAVGKSNIAQRLCESLQVDITETRSSLGWSPPLSVSDAFRKAVRGI